jgi:hypothetical protein
MNDRTLVDTALPVAGDARLLAPEDPEWTATLGRVRHDTYHQPEYVRLDAIESNGTGVAFRYDDGNRVLLLPLTLRRIPDSDRWDAVSPYGYPGPVSDADPVAEVDFWRRACAALVAELAGQGVVSAFIRLHPWLPAPLDVLAGAGAVVHHGQTVSVDLSISLDEMWSQTRRDHRNHINRARRAGLTVRFDDWDRLGEWVDIYHENMRRLGASASYFYSVEHLVALHEALGPRMHLAVALADGRVVGGNTFFEHDGIVQGYVSSSRPTERDRYADKLLYDEVRRWTKERGDTIFHVGGGVGGGADSLFAYKSGFSAQRHPFHTWRVVTEPAAYRSLQRSTGTETDDLTGFFPPYRSR